MLNRPLKMIIPRIFLNKSSSKQKNPKNSNPMNMPKLPPTAPTKVKESTTKNSW